MTSKCAICGAVIFTVTAGTILPSHSWAEAPGCPRSIGCEHRHDPHPLHERPADEGTAQARATVVTSASVSSSDLEMLGVMPRG
jgi:hypothetical protein